MWDMNRTTVKALLVALVAVFSLTSLAEAAPRRVHHAHRVTANRVVKKKTVRKHRGSRKVVHHAQTKPR